MLIPLWIVPVTLTAFYIISCFYFIGNLFYLFTKNKVSIFSENAILWALLISIGGPGSYLFFHWFILDLFSQHINEKNTYDKWEFPKFNTQSLQECCINKLSTIWGFNGGILGKMTNNWKYFC